MTEDTYDGIWTLNQNDGNTYIAGFPISIERIVMVDFSDCQVISLGLDVPVNITLRVGRIFQSSLDVPARVIFQAFDRSFGVSGIWYPDHGKTEGFGYAWAKNRRTVTLFNFVEGWGHQDEVTLKADELSYLYNALARKLFVPEIAKKLPLDIPE